MIIVFSRKVLAGIVFIFRKREGGVFMFGKIRL